MADVCKPIQEISPWYPMSRPIDLKHLGKLLEELGELQAATARCLIQGIDEYVPQTGKPNQQWLEEEIADVLAGIDLVTEHFSLNCVAIARRLERKKAGLRVWHKMLP